MAWWNPIDAAKQALDNTVNAAHQAVDNTVHAAQQAATATREAYDNTTHAVGQAYDTTTRAVADAVDVAHGAVDSSYTGRNAATKTEGMSAEQRAELSRNLQESQKNLDNIGKAADATKYAYKVSGDYIAAKAEGAYEFGSGGALSDAVAKEQHQKLDTIRELQSTDKYENGKPVMGSDGKPVQKNTGEQHESDAKLLKEMQSSVADRLTVLEGRKANGEDVGKEVEAMNKLQALSLAPDKNLDPDTRKLVANTARDISTLKAQHRLSEINQESNDAAKLAEEGLVTGAIAASAALTVATGGAASPLLATAVGGATGFAVSQTIGIADQANMMGKPIDGEDNRRGGAIAKLATGHTDGITYGNIADDVVDVATSAIPFGGLGKGAEQAVTKEVVKETGEALVKQGLKEGMKEGEMALGEQAVKWGIDKVKDKTKDIVLDQTKNLFAKGAETLTGSDKIVDAFGPSANESAVASNTPPATPAVAAANPPAVKPDAPAVATANPPAAKPDAPAVATANPPAAKPATPDVATANPPAAKPDAPSVVDKVSAGTNTVINTVASVVNPGTMGRYWNDTMGALKAGATNAIITAMATATVQPAPVNIDTLDPKTTAPDTKTTNPPTAGVNPDEFKKTAIAYLEKNGNMKEGDATKKVEGVIEAETKIKTLLEAYKADPAKTDLNKLQKDLAEQRSTIDGFAKDVQAIADTSKQPAGAVLDQLNIKDFDTKMDAVDASIKKAAAPKTPDAPAPAAPEFTGPFADILNLINKVLEMITGQTQDGHAAAPDAKAATPDAKPVDPKATPAPDAKKPDAPVVASPPAAPDARKSVPTAASAGVTDHAVADQLEEIALLEKENMHKEYPKLSDKQVDALVAEKMEEVKTDAKIEAGKPISDAGKEVVTRELSKEIATKVAREAAPTARPELDGLVAGGAVPLADAIAKPLGVPTPPAPAAAAPAVVNPFRTPTPAAPAAAAPPVANPLGVPAAAAAPAAAALPVANPLGVPAGAAPAAAAVPPINPFGPVSKPATHGHAHADTAVDKVRKDHPHDISKLNEELYKKIVRDDPSIETSGNSGQWKGMEAKKEVDKIIQNGLEKGQDPVVALTAARLNVAEENKQYDNLKDALDQKDKASGKNSTATEKKAELQKVYEECKDTANMATPPKAISDVLKEKVSEVKTETDNLNKGGKAVSDGMQGLAKALEAVNDLKKSGMGLINMFEEKNKNVTLNTKLTQNDVNVQIVGGGDKDGPSAPAVG